MDRSFGFKLDGHFHRIVSLSSLLQLGSLDSAIRDSRSLRASACSGPAGQQIPLPCIRGVVECVHCHHSYCSVLPCSAFTGSVFDLTISEFASDRQISFTRELRFHLSSNTSSESIVTNET